MHCKNCGNPVEEGQAFCTNCGSPLDAPTPVVETAPMPAAEAAPTPEPDQTFIPDVYAEPTPNAPQSGPFAGVGKVAPEQPLQLPSLGGLTDRFNAMGFREQIYFGSCGLLLIVCFVLSLVKVYAASLFTLSAGLCLSNVAPWLLVISNVLFTICNGLFWLDYSGKLPVRRLPLLVAFSSGLILFFFIVKWIAGVEGYSLHLTVGGWFFLLLMAALTAVSVLLHLERRKKG